METVRFTSFKASPTPQLHIRVRRPYSHKRVQAALPRYNTVDEVDRLLEKLEEIL